MPQENSNATGGDNAQGQQAAGTSTGANDNQNEGQQQSSAAGTSTGANNSQTEGGSQPKTFTQDEVNRMLANERRAAEKKAADAEAKAKLSDDERTKAELAETRAALRERDTRDTVVEAAEKAGVKNPKLFYNAYKSELETDDKGKITNLKEVLETAKTESPELFAEVKKPEGSADAGEGNNTNAGGLTMEKIQKMSSKEVADNMEAIDKFLASQK
ncbi:MAG TPA: hypothetical protein VF599_12485 [Pyrinomonadaceae bacterium]|jgi:hypothetical protein